MRSDAIAALLFAAALGCAHVPGPARAFTVSLGERFTLQPGGSARISGTPARLIFERILSDNRCPVDVVCIVAGEARAWLRMEAEPGRSDTVTLDTDRNPAAVVAGYRVTLLSVSPLPKSPVHIAPGSYSVELAVTRE